MFDDDDENDPARIDDEVLQPWIHFLGKTAMERDLPLQGGADPQAWSPLHRFVGTNIELAVRGLSSMPTWDGSVKEFSGSWNGVLHETSFAIVRQEHDYFLFRGSVSGLLQGFAQHLGLEVSYFLAYYLNLQLGFPGYQPIKNPTYRLEVDVACRWSGVLTGQGDLQELPPMTPELHHALELGGLTGAHEDPRAYLGLVLQERRAVKLFRIASKGEDGAVGVEPIEDGAQERFLRIASRPLTHS